MFYHHLPSSIFKTSKWSPKKHSIAFEETQAVSLYMGRMPAAPTLVRLARTGLMSSHVISSVLTVIGSSCHNIAHHASTSVAGRISQGVSAVFVQREHYLIRDVSMLGDKSSRPRPSCSLLLLLLPADRRYTPVPLNLCCFIHFWTYD